MIMFTTNEVRKGRVFLASGKFSLDRECGPGFRKSLLI